MSHLSDDVLADIASGESVPEADAHLAACERCAASLAELRRAAGFLRAPDLPGPWDRPSDEVWDRVRDTIGATPEEPHAEVESATADVTVLGDRRRRLVTVAAAAACALVGLAVGRWIVPSGSEVPAPTVAATTSLASLDGSRTLGAAELLESTGATPEIMVSTGRFAHGSGYVEVWLINTDGTRMVSLGVLGDDDRGTFPVPQTLLDRGYRIVDISRERFDDDPAHSGDSVMRGTLTT
ncbi:MAG: anti-sigma factor [Thermoleophilia bacterium]|nr:anti-sigma factor [Thermoleophilia bacterium]